MDRKIIQSYWEVAYPVKNSSIKETKFGCASNKDARTDELIMHDTTENRRQNRKKPLTVAYEFITRNEDQPGLEARWINSDIGWGVFATREFLEGQFLLEYSGEILYGKAATTQPDTNYTYHFRYLGQDVCIDATREKSSGPTLGRLVNHGDYRAQRNSVMKRVIYKEEPHLCLFSTRKIGIGDQLLYDYGVKNLPWQKGNLLATKQTCMKRRRRTRRTGCRSDSKAPETSQKASGNLWGSVVVMRDNMELAAFPMTSTKIAIGSDRSNCIIVKGAATHEVTLEVNMHGEVFLVSRNKGRLLKDNEMFIVGRRTFKWKYASQNEVSLGTSVKMNRKQETSISDSSNTEHAAGRASVSNNTQIGRVVKKVGVGANTKVNRKRKTLVSDASNTDHSAGIAAVSNHREIGQLAGKKVGVGANTQVSRKRKTLVSDASNTQRTARRATVSNNRQIGQLDGKKVAVGANTKVSRKRKTLVSDASNTEHSAGRAAVSNKRQIGQLAGKIVGVGANTKVSRKRKTLVSDASNTGRTARRAAVSNKRQIGQLAGKKVGVGANTKVNRKRKTLVSDANNTDHSAGRAAVSNHREIGQLAGKKSVSYNIRNVPRYMTSSFVLLNRDAEQENGTRFTDSQTATALEICTENDQNEEDSVSAFATKGNLADFLKDPDSNSAENGTRFTDPQTATALENCTESNQNETDSVNVIATKDSIADLLKEPHSNSAENGTIFTDSQTANALENCSENYQNEADCVNAIASKDNVAVQNEMSSIEYEAELYNLTQMKNNPKHYVGDKPSSYTSIEAFGQHVCATDANWSFDDNQLNSSIFDWHQSTTSDSIIQILAERLHIPAASVKNSNLTDGEVIYLLSLCNSIDQDQNNLNVNELQNMNKNIKYIKDVLFGSVSLQRLNQVSQIESVYGPHHVQGHTNYCGFCSLANAFANITPESTSIKEMDTMADKLWLQMIINPSLGFLAELEPMRDQEGFYSIEVLKATVKDHGFEMNKIDERALLGQNPNSIGRYVTSNLHEQVGMVSLIIRQRNHQHWLNITVQDSTPILRDSLIPFPRPITIDELGHFIGNNLESPGAVFFLSREADPIQRVIENCDSDGQHSLTSHDKTTDKTGLQNSRMPLRKHRNCYQQTVESITRRTVLKQQTSIDSDEEMDSDDTENDPTYMQSEGEDDGSSFEEECSSSDESKGFISNIAEVNEANHHLNNKVHEPITNEQHETHRKVEQPRESIAVPTVTVDGDGHRKRKKVHRCCFCEKYYPRISRHLETHVKEDEIKYLKLLKDEDRRRKELDRLRLRGNYMHNISVINENKGSLILGRTPSNDGRKYKVSDFAPCEHCRGFYVRWELWRHQKKCKFAPSKDEKRRNNAQRNSVLLMESSRSKRLIDQKFLENVVSRMIVDSVSLVARNDIIGLKYGELQYASLTNRPTRRSCVSSDLRLLARLVLQMRDLTGLEDGYLREFLKVKHFDTLIDAAHALAKAFEKDETTKFEKPSVAQKIGRLLTKCCSVLEGEASRRNDEEDEKQANRLKRLIDNEWLYKVNVFSHETVRDNCRNNPILLPTTQDLLKLKDHTDSAIKMAQNRLKVEITMENFQALQSLLLCRLIMFNRLRTGDVSDMRLADYQGRPDWKNVVNEEIYQSLTKLEQQLVNRLDMIEIRGKSRGVNLILTPETQEVLDLLIECRSAVGILPANIYLFPRSIGGGYIEGHKCLKELVNSIEGIEFPDRICSTRMRKYIATVVQVMNLNNAETEWLARHLGHSVRIHKDFYRLQTPAIELGRVARLLIAVDNGKTLENISDDQEVPMDDEIEESDEDVETESINNTRPEMECDGRRAAEHDYDYSSEINDGTQSDEDADVKQAITSGPTKYYKKRKYTEPIPWTIAETEAIMRQMGEFLFRKKAPNQEACEAARANEPALQHRHWKNVKYKVHNLILKSKKEGGRISKKKGGRNSKKKGGRKGKKKDGR